MGLTVRRVALIGNAPELSLKKEEDLSMSGLEVETSEENCPTCGERQIAVYWSLDTGDNVMWKCQACGVKGFFKNGTILTVEQPSSGLGH